MESGHPPAAQPPDAGPGHSDLSRPGGRYEVWADLAHQDEYSRFMPLVKWLLAFPHYVALVFVGIAALFAILASFFAVLFTGRYPRGLHDFVVGTYRWGWRVGAYVLLMTDRYPPFALADDPDYPARYDVEYPEAGVDRWRPLVHWILIFPYHLVAALLAYLAGLMAFFAFFTILFTKRFPESLFGIALNSLRWGLRSNAYANWLVTRYPPWEWDTERPASATSPAP